MYIAKGQLGCIHSADEVTMVRSKYRGAVCALLLSAFLLPIPETSRAVHADGHPPDVTAEAAALIDVESGRLLYSKNGDRPMRIASLTKIMTAIVAIEQGRLSDMVKVSKNAYGKEGSSIYLRLGEEMSLEHLLYGLMLRSGNDAATAIAEHVGGSEEGFVLMMNRKAEELGLQNTHFANPHGLDADGHMSTANDLARLTAYALKNPVFREIVKTERKTAPNPNDPWDYVWRNKNKMLRLYEGADGVKTGFTKAAGRCLVSSATRNGQQLAAVTLRASNDWNDHAKLLDFGFAHYELETLVHKGANIQGTDFVAERSFRYPLTAEEKSSVRLILDKLPEHSLDYALGLRGRLRIEVGGDTIGQVPVVEQGSPRLMRADTAFGHMFPGAPEEAQPTDAVSSFLRVLRTVFCEVLS